MLLSQIYSPLAIGTAFLSYKLPVKIHQVIIGLNLYLNFQIVILCLIDHFSKCFLLSLVRYLPYVEEIIQLAEDTSVVLKHCVANKTETMTETA